MLRDVLALLAQRLGEGLTANAALRSTPLPDIPRALGKCLSSGCYAASSCFMVLSVLFAPPAQARPEDAPDRAADQVASPYFYLPGGDPAVDALPLKATDVEVRIAGVIADVTVTQTYKNEGTRPIEAKYVFPGSTRAAVHGMQVRLADRLIEARIREKQQAKQEYEQAKSEGKTAALLEQHRPNVFQMNVANILPGDDVRVELRYTELLTPESGRYRFVFPTVAGPRYNSPQSASAQEQWVAQPTLPDGVDSPAKFDIRLWLDTPISIKEVASISHEIELRRPDARSAEIGLAAKARQAANNRDFILDYRLAGNAVESGVMLMRGQGEGAENFFLAMVEPPKAVPASVVVPRDYIFVVDISGSMHGFPLDTAKTLLRELIGGLRPGDTFNVLLFAGSSDFLHPQSVPASRENVGRALQLIDRANGVGGTELIPALRHVYALDKPADVSRTVVVVTDGYVSVESEAFSLVRRNLDRGNLFAFGIGSSVNRHLIEGLARAGMGEPFVITDPAAAPEEAKRFRRMIASPVLTGVRAAFAGVETWDVAPQTVPDVFSERPVVLFGKWRDGKGEGPKQLVMEGQGADGAYRQTLPLLEALDEGELTNPSTPFPGKGASASSQGSQADNDPALGRPGGEDQLTSPPPPFPGKGASTSSQGSRIDNDPALGRTGFGERLSALRRLWARQRINDLSDQENLMGDGAQREAITALGLEYSLLTQYTSFVAVDRQIRNLESTAAASVDQPQPLPQGVSDLAVGGAHVPGAPEPKALGALLVTLSMLAMVARRLSRQRRRHLTP